MSNTRAFLISCFALSFFGFSTLTLLADSLKPAEMKAVLDAPEAFSFSSGTNVKKLASYTEKNIGITRKDGPGVVKPQNGLTFLEMEGSGSKGKDPRAQRIKSSFSVQIAGSGELYFDHRVSTYGRNDDYLVIYEDDIDDELLYLGGDYWDKYRTEGLLPGYTVTVDTFWDNAYISLDSERYFHTVYFALLAPYSTDYEAPEDEDADILNKAWLDNFTWEEGYDVLCEFQPESGATFGGEGLNVYLNTDYDTVKFYYTTDGSTPTSSSKAYVDDMTGILITQNTVLKVAAYEGGKLISNELSAEYTMRPAPKAPICGVAAQEPNGNATAYFKIPETTQQFEFFYTTDGTDPTLDSPSGNSCVLSSPCTLKVRANDEGILGEISTYTVKTASVPRMQFFVDVLPADNCVFDETGWFSLQSDGTSYYTLGGGDPIKYMSTDVPVVSESTTLTYWTCVDDVQETLPSGSEILLNSVKTSQELVKAELRDSAWLSEQLVSDGWNIVGMTRVFSQQTGASLAELLNPYAYDATRNVYEAANLMEPGRAYWVYGRDHEIPAQISYVDETAEPVQSGNNWDMTSGKANFTYENGIFRETAPGENVPGWKKNE